MNRTGLLLCLLTLPLAGCLRQPSPSSVFDGGTILTYLDDPAIQTGVEYVALDHRVVLLIWSDVVGESTRNSSSSGKGVSLHGQLSSEDDRRIVWRSEISSKGAGTLSLDGTTYDLTDGFFFLVSMRDDSLNIKQLDRDTIAIGDVGSKIRELAKEKEIIQFFAQ